MPQTNSKSKTIKVWLPSIASLCAVMVAGGFALARKTAASEGIREMSDLGVNLTATATDIQRETLSPRQTEALLEQKRHLEERIRDAAKPGKIVQQLSESARKVELQVLQIQPVQGRPRNHRSSESDQSFFRISVRGSYQKIATYLEGCKAQRIPLRVIGFRLRSFGDSGQTGHTDLKAEITVEAPGSIEINKEGNINP